MKICADEHISPKIVHAVREIALHRQCSIFAVQEIDLRGHEDEIWISAFARMGGTAILSGDRRMLKRQCLLSSLHDLGLVAIFLPSDWAEGRRHFQAAHVLFWWPIIQEACMSAPKGSIWTVPKDFAVRPLYPHVQRISKSARALLRKPD